MSAALIFAVAALAAIGTYLITARSLSRIVLGFSLLGHAAVLALLASGGPAGEPPLADRSTTDVDGHPAAPGAVADRHRDLVRADVVPARPRPSSARAHRRRPGRGRSRGSSDGAAATPTPTRAEHHEHRRRRHRGRAAGRGHVRSALVRDTPSSATSITVGISGRRDRDWPRGCSSWSNARRHRRGPGRGLGPRARHRARRRPVRRTDPGRGAGHDPVGRDCSRSGSVAAAWGADPRLAGPILLVLTAGVALAILTGDLFTLFVAFELILVSSYVLLDPPGSAAVRSGRA